MTKPKAKPYIEPLDPDVTFAQLAASAARVYAAEQALRKLAEDARLALEPVIKLPPGIFIRRPHLFRPIFEAIAQAAKREP